MELNRDAPAKGDLLDLEARLNERHKMLRAEVGHTRDDLIETMRNIQTEMLKAFYNFGRRTVSF